MNLEADIEEDWPDHTHRRELLALDEAARCAICCEFFDTPMCLPCGHTFCSQCIRGNLRHQEQQGSAKCPQCRAPCDTRDLRPNPALKELISKFIAVRSVLICDLAALPQLRTELEQLHEEQQQQQQQQQRSHQQQRRGRKRQQDDSAPATASEPASQRLTRASSKRSRQSVDSEAVTPLSQEESQEWEPSDTSPSPVKTRRRSSNASSLKPGRSPANQPDASEKQKPSASNPRPDASLEAQKGSNHTSSAGPSAASNAAPAKDANAHFLDCPVCGKQIHHTLVNMHLDECLAGGGSDPGPAKTSKPSRTKNPQQHAGPSTSHPSASAAQQAPSTHKQGRNSTDRAASANGPVQHDGSGLGPGKGMKKKQGLPVVPPKIAFALMGDKQLREKLKALSLPVIGKRSDLENRYSRFRTAAETARDRGEAVSGPELARRIMSEDRHVAAVNFTSQAGRGAQKPSLVAPSTENATGGNDSFRKLIAETRARDAARQKSKAEADIAESSEPIGQHHANRMHLDRSASLPSGQHPDGSNLHQAVSTSNAAANKALQSSNPPEVPLRGNSHPQMQGPVHLEEHAQPESIGNGEAGVLGSDNGYDPDHDDMEDPPLSQIRWEAPSRPANWQMDSAPTNASHHDTGQHGSDEPGQLRHSAHEGSFPEAGDDASGQDDHNHFRHNASSHHDSSHADPQHDLQHHARQHDDEQGNTGSPLRLSDGPDEADEGLDDPPLSQMRWIDHPEKGSDFGASGNAKQQHLQNGSHRDRSKFDHHEQQMHAGEDDPIIDIVDDSQEEQDQHNAAELPLRRLQKA